MIFWVFLVHPTVVSVLLSASGNIPVMPLMTRDKTGSSRDKTGTGRDKTGTSRDATGTAGTTQGQ